MSKVMRIAIREFVTTVATKAFIVGLLFFPVIVLVTIFVIGLIDDDSFQLEGEVAIVDPTGRISPRIQDEFDARARTALPDELVQATGVPPEMAERVQNAVVPRLELVVHPADADIDEQKEWLIAQDAAADRLGLVVVHDDAIVPASPGSEFGTYDLYVPPNSDERALSAIHASLRNAIRSERLGSQGFDRTLIDRLTSVAPVQSVTVTQASGGEEGVSERTTVRGFNVMLPMAAMILLFMGVMGGGQALLTTTVTEKSSRVIEVLLSAVSPMQLMAGKLIGHLTVGLLGMSFYLAAGVFALVSFSMLELLDPMLIVYLLVFFVITFFVLGSIMLGVGAAVNDVSETQSLMMPIMIVFMSPWFLWFPISRDPDSTLSVVVSFLPPINMFGMLLRVASTEPPPAWQIWLSIAIGIATVYGAVWFASKVFRIGLLLHGKPPDFRTLVRWVRAA